MFTGDPLITQDDPKTKKHRNSETRHEEIMRKEKFKNLMLDDYTNVSVAASSVIYNLLVTCFNDN